MDYSTKRRIKGSIKGIVKNVLPYGISTRVFPPRNILESEPPKIFNSKGERMLIAYLQDIHIQHAPYGYISGRFPDRLFWDRYNYKLRTHFYSHNEIFNRREKGEGAKHFGLLIESQNVMPEDYTHLLNRPDAVKELDALFTYDERLLDKYDNALFSIAGGVWYGTELQGGNINDKLIDNKSKLLSIVSSAKTIRPLAKFRHDLALEINQKGLGDVMGKCVGKWVTMDDVYTDYMFSIGIENTRNKYYFTEKILNCFASMTIPVYYGATEINKFFNEDGIVVIKEPTIECAIKTIKECTRDNYESRRAAILDNFERVKSFMCVEDYLTAHYFDRFVF